MIRLLIISSLVAIGIAGCCSSPNEQRFVPTSTVMRVEPQPTTYAEFQDAEQQGCLIAATGLGMAFGLGDQPVRMQAGEALHVLGIDARSGEVLVRRLEYYTLARISAEGLEVKASAYGR